MQSLGNLTDKTTKVGGMRGFAGKAAKWDCHPAPRPAHIWWLVRTELNPLSGPSGALQKRSGAEDHAAWVDAHLS